MTPALPQVQGFRLVPPAASAYARQADALFYALIGLEALIVAGLAVVIVCFAVRYRRGSRAPRMPRTAHRTQVRIELAWMLIPLGIFTGLFAWAGMLYLRLFEPPPEALTIHAVAKQWMWQFQHPGGQREINTLHVPRGRAVRVRLTSQDVIHSLYLPALRVKRDVLPWNYTELWFEPLRTGRFHLMCAEYCGTEHSAMRGRLVVLEPDAYAAWLARQGVGDTPAQRGAALFRGLGCSGCHGASAQVRAPALAGLYGRPVPLAGGGTVRADETYLRDSILQPRRHVVAGYAPVMPSFAGQIGEMELLDLIAYIRSLVPGEDAQP
jgi:cytochrome c oxidase subunit II